MRISQDFLRLGAIVIFIGFTILILSVVLTISSQHPGNSQIGGVIMIGPIPIAFGSSPEITTNMLGLGLIVSILYLFLWRMKR